MCDVTSASVEEVIKVYMIVEEGSNALSQQKEHLSSLEGTVVIIIPTSNSCIEN